MLRLENVIVDAHEIRALAAFWRQAPGWVTVVDEDGEICLSAPGGDVNNPATWPFPDLVFEPVERPDAGRQRVHLDLASASLEDQHATVVRLQELGATRVDVGQGPDVTWVVLADPEGNEVCVLSPRD